MKELYMANVWPQIITKRGVSLLNEAGYSVSGNWLNGQKDYASATKVILPYADFGESAPLPDEKSDMWKKIVSYILFPDSMVGWNYDTNSYQLQQKTDVKLILDNSSKRLSHSRFSSNLVAGVYDGSDEVIVPLGIDLDTIRQNIENSPRETIRVLWNHMWRQDKGTREAFEIIENLAKRHPKIEFRIGQNNTWDVRPETQKYKAECMKHLEVLKQMPNVIFFDRIKDQKQYWQWIGQSDIAFSTSFHEGFGLSMLEQEAAGLACIVPNSECYPEIHAGCLLTKRCDIEKGIETLISDTELRKAISQGCIENSYNYDTSIWVKNLVANMD